jgi:hypothetical protein
MASTYPATLDALTNPSPGDSQALVSHAGQHGNANDAIEAIEATLGTNPQDAYATVAARLTAIAAGLTGNISEVLSTLIGEMVKDGREQESRSHH